jgi:hypothetical protein
LIMNIVVNISIYGHYLHFFLEVWQHLGTFASNVLCVGSLKV